MENKKKNTSKILAKAKVKKVEIRKDGMYYAYCRPGAEVWSTGYASRWTARRGATRHFRGFITNGGQLVFTNA